MKKLLLPIFVFGIISSGISQAVSDRNTVPVAVNLNRVLRMSVNTGGNIEFTFNTIDDYKNGLSGDAATSTSANPATSNPMYVTTFTVAASTKWTLQYGAEEGTFIGVDNPASTLALNNVGFNLASTGTHVFGTELVSAPTTNGGVIADLDVYPTALIADGANAAANAGDATDNAFTMTWRVGTAEGDMFATKLIEQSITPDRYVTNVLFNLVADN
ncbi:MAG: hypothetical protein CL851_02465 [Crocinitomicaceae bacterium]|nr:hypothetical protein [Crocinitomicaceae bacterium]